MKAVILAAGIGARMGDLTRDAPKCFLKVGNKTLLERQIQILNSLKIEDITIVIGGEGSCWTLVNQEKIRALISKVIVNPENISKNCSFSLKLFLDKETKDDLLIIDGDIFFNRNLITQLISSKENRIIVRKVDRTILTNRVSIADSGRVLGVVRQQGDNPAQGGLIKINSKYFNIIKKLIEEGGYKTDLTYMLDKLGKQEELYSSLVKEIANINTKEDLEKINKNFYEPKCVIWDFDGVIFDSAHFKIQAYKQVLQKVGIKMLDKDFYENNGRGAKDALQRICSKYGKDCDIDKLIKEKEEIYINLINKNISPMPGVKKLVENLNKAGYSQAIATSTSKSNLLFMLKKFSLENYFQALVTGEDIILNKPNPEPFLKAALNIGVAPEDCLVIEDSIHGIKAAKQAKMKCIAVTFARKIKEDLSEATLIVKNLEEVSESTIKRILEK
jgi:HAD superfamily hydrolase (TIGR01509 family)